MMKSMKSMLMGGAILLGLAMCLTSCEGTLDDIFGEWSRPSGNNDNTKTSVTSIELNKETLELAAGETGQLTATVDPSGSAVTWSSDKEEVATVDANGLVTAVAAGIATITAKAGDKTATCEVTVTPSLSTPLTMEAITAGTITVNSIFMKFSLNGGAKTDITVTPTYIAVAAGDKVEFYGTATFYMLTPIGGSGDGFKCKVYGNIMSLLYEDFADKTELPNTYTFNGLFNNNTKLIDASGLLLPAVTLKDYCYNSMFFGCSSLTTAPALPATTLATSCYGSMFLGCTALTTAPELKATTLVNDCYNKMFYNCSNLNSVTCLATDISADACTGSWLEGVAASGTFTTPSTTVWGTGSNKIPDGWTRKNPDGTDYAP